MSLRLFYARFLYSFFIFFFFNDTATTEIYTLSLHDALPIFTGHRGDRLGRRGRAGHSHRRSEEHTSELQSHHDLVCRLLLEKKKKTVNEKQNKKKNKRTKQNTNKKAKK